jgi:hypothetical protein
MLENDDNISLTTLVQFFLKNKFKLIALSLLTTLFIVFSLNYLNTQYKLSYFKFSFKQLDDSITYRKGDNFYSELISGKKINDLLSNFDLNYNIVTSIPNTKSFSDIIYIFTNDFIEAIKYDEKYKNLNLLFSKEKDRNFSSTLVIKSEDVDFNKFKKEIFDTFNNDLNNHLNKKIQFLFQIINFQLNDKINELEKANLYLLEANTNKKIKNTNKKIKKKSIPIREKLGIIENLTKRLDNVNINLGLGDFNDEFNDKSNDESNDEENNDEENIVPYSPSPYLIKYNDNIEIISFIEKGLIQKNLEEELSEFIRDFSMNPLFKNQYYEKNILKIKPFFVSLYAYVIYFIFIFVFYIFIFSYIKFFKSK